MSDIETTLAPLFDGLSDGICISDAENGILYINPAAERLLGVDLRDALGQKSCSLLCGRLAVEGSPECASQCPLRAPQDSHRAVTFVGLYSPKPAFRWVETEVRRLENGGHVRVRCARMPAPMLEPERGERRFTIIEDVAAEMELERRKEDWRSMLAHDLRSPLTNVYGLLRAVQDENATPSPQPIDRGLIDIGVRNCRRIMEILDLYLETAKFDAGSMPVEIAEHDLRELVAGCVEEQGFLAKERRVEIRQEIPAALRVRADRRLLYRAVQNVLSNAVKFSPAGGRVDISAKDAGDDRVELAVRDAGPGIPAEEIPRLFDRYHQAQAGRRGMVPGTGLGLAFCRQALEAMGGRVTAESGPGAGSVFTLHLKGACYEK
jgi:signal transduction histidine kinase